MAEVTKEWWLARVEALEKELDSVQKELVLGLESLEEKVRELESKLAKEKLRVSHLEMELDLARSKLMVKDQAMKKVLVLLLVSVLGTVGALLFLKEMVKVLEMDSELEMEQMMEWVLVSALLLGSVLVWAFVKVMQMALAWKLVQELKSAEALVREMKLDLELARVLEKWKAEEQALLHCNTVKIPKQLCLHKQFVELIHNNEQRYFLYLQSMNLHYPNQY